MRYTNSVFLQMTDWLRDFVFDERKKKNHQEDLYGEKKGCGDTRTDKDGTTESSAPL